MAAHRPFGGTPGPEPVGVSQGAARGGSGGARPLRVGSPRLHPPRPAAGPHASESGGSFEVTGSMDEAFADADAVYPKSWGPLTLMRERVEANRAGDAERMTDIESRALEQNARHRDWICDERRMGLTTGGGALYMHCLPADIGAEVSASVMDRYRNEVAREANKKVYVIMAVLAAAKVEDLSGRLAALEA